MYGVQQTPVHITDIITISMIAASIYYSAWSSNVRVEVANPFQP
jgi:hypothetical protein